MSCHESWASLWDARLILKLGVSRPQSMPWDKWLQRHDSDAMHELAQQCAASAWLLVRRWVCVLLQRREGVERLALCRDGYTDCLQRGLLQDNLKTLLSIWLSHWRCLNLACRCGRCCWGILGNRAVQISGGTPFFNDGVFRYRGFRCPDIWRFFDFFVTALPRGSPKVASFRVHPWNGLFRNFGLFGLIPWNHYKNRGFRASPKFWRGRAFVSLVCFLKNIIFRKQKIKLKRKMANRWGRRRRRKTRKKGEHQQCNKESSNGLSMMTRERRKIFSQTWRRQEKEREKKRGYKIEKKKLQMHKKGLEE